MAQRNVINCYKLLDTENKNKCTKTILANNRIILLCDLKP